MRVVGTCLTSLLALTACVGGGGGSGSGVSRLNLPLSADPATFETAEYRQSGGLEAIEASTIYAAGGTGQGVTVGVIDTGIDTGHPEFAGALHPASTDLVRNAPLTDGSGHGTAVAGLIAARRNGQLTHGAAYDAQLLVVRADTAGSCPDACVFSQGNLALATDYAVAQGAKVLNFSLGDAGGLAGSLESSLSAAAAADRVLVFASGNLGAASPRQPALFATTPAARGRGIIVGAVDDDEVISAFSNRAGGAADVYLVAPGENLRTTAAGGGSAFVSGTSGSTPLVAGAAATVLSAAPHLSGDQVVSILLDSARDLGAPGTDAVYGRGMLDLARALQPAGPLRLPEGGSTSGPARPLAGSRVSFSDAFGAVVPRLGPVMALDAYDRGYDVGEWLVAPRRRRPALPDFVARQAVGPRERLAAGPVTVELGRAGLASTAARPGESDIVGFAAGVALSEGLRLRASLGETESGGAAAGSDTLPGRLAGFWDLAGTARVGLDVMTAEGWRLSLDLGGQSGDPLARPLEAGLAPAFPGSDAARSARLAALAIERRWRRAGRWRLALGHLSEGEGPLGSRMAGAMATAGTGTEFLDLAATLPLGPGLEAFGRAQLGRTSFGGGDGLVGEADSLWSSAFEVGLGVGDVFRPSDRLGFSLLQPLRVEGGSMVLDLPVARNLAGNVLRQRRKVGLAPDGRELDLELSYGLDLGGGRLQSALMLRLEPDHDAEAEAELLLGLAYRLTF